MKYNKLINIYEEELFKQASKNEGVIRKEIYNQLAHEKILVDFKNFEEVHGKINDGDYIVPINIPESTPYIFRINDLDRNNLSNSIISYLIIDRNKPSINNNLNGINYSGKWKSCGSAWMVDSLNGIFKPFTYKLIKKDDLSKWQKE